VHFLVSKVPLYHICKAYRACSLRGPGTRGAGASRRILHGNPLYINQNTQNTERTAGLGIQPRVTPVILLGVVSPELGVAQPERAARSSLMRDAAADICCTTKVTLRFLG